MYHAHCVGWTVDIYHTAAIMNQRLLSGSDNCNQPTLQYMWWRHQMETFFALLALCAGNSPVTGEFPSQRPVTRSFDVFFDLRLNKQASKHLWGWWFETPSRSLWRHHNESAFCAYLIVLTLNEPCSILFARHHILSTSSLITCDCSWWFVERFYIY